MDPRSLVAIVLAALLVWYYARKEYCAGVCWAVFFLVWMPHAVRVETGDAIPEFTIHRIILLVLVGVGMSQGRFGRLRERVPLFGLLVAMFVSYSFSTLFALDFGMAFKRLFYILFESYLLYVAIVVGVAPHQAERVLKSALLGLLLIGILGPLEYYNGLNVIGKFLPVSVDNQGVIQTYEHSIHYGYAMAMAIPFAVVFASRAKSVSGFCFYFGAVGIFLASCYFSFSRGALLGGILAVGLVLLFGGRPLRKLSYALGLIILIGLVAKPGVRETMFGMVDSVLVQDGEQDASAEYRKTLWKVAYVKVSESPIKLVFGLGGASTMLLDISEFFERQRGGQVMEQGFSSWDSQWAANLLQFGFAGLIIELSIWGGVFWALFSAWFRSGAGGKDPLVFGVLAGCAVYVWAMLTVAMFSPQLKYLASTFMGCGLLLARQVHLDGNPDTEIPDPWSDPAPPEPQSGLSVNSRWLALPIGSCV